jgi:hypothetical protein
MPGLSTSVFASIVDKNVHYDPSHFDSRCGMTVWTSMRMDVEVPTVMCVQDNAHRRSWPVIE